MGQAMRLALIPPFQMLEDTYKSSVQMMLPHLLANSNYTTHFASHCLDEVDLVMMDNGAAERKTFQFENLMEIALGMQVNEIVAPDMMGKPVLSVMETTKFLDFAKAQGFEVPVGVVAHGNNTPEVLWSACALLNKHPQIKIVYLPRLLVQFAGDTTRLDAARILKNRYPDIDIHFLGASTLWCGEVREAARSGLVRSLDTSMPYVYAAESMHLRLNSPRISHRDGDSDYFTRIWNNEEVALARNNVETILSWVRDE
jgi:hypothetical protein